MPFATSSPGSWNTNNTAAPAISITAVLTVAANWDLPPARLRRQSHRELERAVMELQRSGFSNEEIQSHENALRQNGMASTARGLKMSHFT